MRDLVAAWRAVEHHPIGILLPAAGQMALAVLAMLAVRPWMGPNWPSWLAAWAVARAVLLVAQVPLRGWMLVAGARALGVASLGPRVGPLMAFQVIDSLASGAVLLLIAVPSLALGGAIVAEGWVASGLGVAAAGVAGAEVASLMVEAALAGAPSEIVLGGRSGLGALSASLEQFTDAFLARLWLLFAGRVALIVGGLGCGAGALPGFPIADLAVMSHWLRLTGRAGGPELAERSTPGSGREGALAAG
jgi:hypothetical protein